MKDLIELLKAGDSILSGGVAAKLRGIYKAGSAVYNLFQNGKKLKAATKAMIDGGLGIMQCDALK